MQSAFENTCVIYAASASTRGIHFSLDFSWNDAVVVTISDASFCQEQEQLDRVSQNSTPRQVYITALELGDALNAARMLIHTLSWGLTENQSSLPQF